MEYVAASAEDSASAEKAAQRGRLVRIAADLGPKLFITLVAAGVSALLIPWFTGKWQDHKQQLELRTTLAGEMSRAYTSVIVTGRFVTEGLVYSGSSLKVKNTATTQQAWTGALRDWLVESGTIGAQLTGRYGNGGIAHEWRDYSAAVLRYMRIGSVVGPVDRSLLLAEEKAYVGSAKLGWPALGRLNGFKDDRAFVSAYENLGAWLLGRGDALVERELRLSPQV